MNLARRILPVGALALVLSHCGGSTAGVSVDAGPDGDSGLCEGTAHGAPPGVPAEHRAAAAMCPRTPATLPDGGSPPGSCNTDGDCQGNTGATWIHCVEHACGADQCLVDAECTAGQVCVCNAAAGGGTRTPGNVCVPGSCRVDADCGGGGYCTPSRGGCGDLNGFYCTSDADTCVDPKTDCGCGGTGCVYEPTVSHFVCATSTCNG